MLRAAMGASPGGSGGSGGGSTAAPLQLPDLEQLLQQRNQLLAGRRRERADMQVASARSQLVAAVLGSWAGAPKAAREEFEKYMRGEGRLAHFVCLSLLCLGSAAVRLSTLLVLRSLSGSGGQGPLLAAAGLCASRSITHGCPMAAHPPCAAVAVLLGGESSSEEVVAAAAAAWRALCAHPPNTDRGRGQIAALQPAR
jgi:hypothetical protein